MSQRCHRELADRAVRCAAPIATFGRCDPSVLNQRQTLDGCCDHRAIVPDEELHRYTAERLAQADALLFGRVTYQLMEAGWRQPAEDARPEWMESFAAMINAAKKYVVSSTLDSVDWNAELVRGDLRAAVQQLKSKPGNGLYVVRGRDTVTSGADRDR